MDGLVSTIKDLIYISNTHKTILTEMSEDNKVFEDVRCWNFQWDNEDENVEGPDCYLCGNEAMADQQLIEHENIMYTVVFKKECTHFQYISKTFAAHHKEFLQCVYCFNFFHRHKCILSMSDREYYELKCNKGWSCPTCVPEYRVRKVILRKKTPNLTLNIEFLLLVFKAIYHLYNFFGQSPFMGVFELFLCLQGLFSAIVWFLDTG
ncbi:unnamed protein product [Orchesella dallaii]|uniref:Uncharacterized protein n=1 Tax=Orchesella dallaii TaxID=48710 RepID=A0ABP1QVA4_9HEXA